MTSVDDNTQVGFFCITDSTPGTLPNSVSHIGALFAYRRVARTMQIYSPSDNSALYQRWFDGSWSAWKSISLT